MNALVEPPDATGSALIAEKLSAAVEDFNAAEGNPEERVRLMHHIRELRARLAGAQSASAQL